MPVWVCERCGEDKKPLDYHPASTPGCYGGWYCFACLKIVEWYREAAPLTMEEKIAKKWANRKSNEH